MSNTKERPSGKLIGRSYDSVAALMRGEGMSPEVQAKVEKHMFETRLTLHLAKMRQAAGITQKDMAEALGMTQPTISKLEAGTDEHVTMHLIHEYARVTNSTVTIRVGKPISDMEAIVQCVDELEKNMLRLAESANQNGETEDKVKGFIGQASRSILNAVALCNCKLPVRESDNVEEVRVEVITGKKILTRATPRVAAV
jgi:transcriptional regulator with XRE-family HTH domain